MRSRSTLAPLVLSFLLTGTLVGCSDDTPAATPLETSSVIPTPTPSTPPSADGALTVADSSGSVPCVDHASGKVELGILSYTLTAKLPLTIVSVVANGYRASVSGSQSLAVRLTRARFPAFIATDWPPKAPGKPFMKMMDWSGRSKLVGVRMEAGEHVLPVLHVSGRPGGQISGVEVGFELADGGAVSSVTIPFSTTFAAKTCPGGQ